jgi:SAM-dependent methyltransferase
VDNTPLGSADPELRKALTQRLQRRAVVTGEMTVPAVPGMLEEYVEMCTDTFAALGVHFADVEIAHLRSVLEGQLAEAYAASPRSNIVISYQSPVGNTVSYNVAPQWSSLESAYDNWVATREPPYFGTEPDARVSALAAEAADPAAFPVLDIGAGTGRNSLALARRGHPVDAVEMSPKFAEIILTEAQREGLNVRVTLRDVFTTTSDLRRDYQLILLSEVVSDFRSTDQLAAVFTLAAECLAPGGRLVFNIFLARDGYVPDEAARQLGEQCYTSIFTYPELAQASAMVPLELVADDSVYDYEKTHLAPEAWPPTSWYAEWVSGQDVFAVPREQCPIEMRWLVYRKADWIMTRSGGGNSPTEW